MTILNLQNAPALAGVTSQPINIKKQKHTLKGTLYMPENATPPLPAVIVTGAWTTIKEQMSGTYTRELAARGFIALAFDFSGWGESEGDPRYVEDPNVKTGDIHVATDRLANLDIVDRDHIYGLGICASSGYMAAAVADNEHLQKLALVAPWLHDPKMAEEIYGGSETARALIQASEPESAADTILTAASATDETAVMYQAPYYTETNRGLIPEYDNKFSLASWQPWLTYDAFLIADRLNKPTLVIGSPGMALPAGAESFEARLDAPLEKIWLEDDVNQFEFYDRQDVVWLCADAIARFFNT